MRSAWLLILVVMVVGCHKQRSIVGQWSTRTDVGYGTIIFRDDRTFRAVRETPLASLYLDGTYEYLGENLRLHIVKWSVPKGPKMTDKDLQTMNKAFQTDARSTVSWADDNHIRLSGAGGELTTAERLNK